MKQDLAELLERMLAAIEDDGDRDPRSAALRAELAARLGLGGHAAEALSPASLAALAAEPRTADGPGGLAGEGSDRADLADARQLLADVAASRAVIPPHLSARLHFPGAGAASAGARRLASAAVSLSRLVIGAGRDISRLVLETLPREGDWSLQASPAFATRGEGESARLEGRNARDGSDLELLVETTPGATYLEAVIRNYPEAAVPPRLLIKRSGAPEGEAEELSVEREADAGTGTCRLYYQSDPLDPGDYSVLCAYGDGLA